MARRKCLIYRILLSLLLFHILCATPTDSHLFACGGRRKKKCKKLDHCRWKKGRCRFDPNVHVEPKVDFKQKTYLLMFVKVKPRYDLSLLPSYINNVVKAAMQEHEEFPPSTIETSSCGETSRFRSMVSKYEAVANLNEYDRTYRLLLQTYCVTITGVAFAKDEHFGEFQRFILNQMADSPSSVATVYSIHAETEGAKDPLRKPNIVFMLADDLGYGDVGYQTPKSGPEQLKTPYHVTPNINALSESPSSVVFDRFYTSPICGPSRYAFLSGRQPLRECFERNIFFEPEKDSHRVPEIECVKSLPNYLKSAGYHTFHAGKWHISKISSDDSADSDAVSTPGRNGFDEWVATESLTPTHRPNCGCFPWYSRACDMGLYGETWSYFNTIYTANPRKFLSPSSSNHFECTPYFSGQAGNKANVYNSLIEEDDSEFIVDKFEQFLRHEDRSKAPFYAQLWFHAPHAPYVCSSDQKRALAQYYLDSQPRKQQEKCGWIYDIPYIFRFRQAPEITRSCKKAIRNSDRCKSFCRRIKIEFYCTLLTLDEQVGRVLDLLQDVKKSTNTMVIFASDNGPARLDRNNRYIGPGSAANLEEFKFSVHEGGTRVPLIINYPAMIPSNFRTQIPASSFDLLPTLLDVAQVGVDGGSRDGKLDGISLVPYLTQGILERHKPIVLSNSFGDVHMIYNNVSFIQTRGVSALQRYNNRAERLLLQKHKRSPKWKRVLNSLRLNYNTWKARVRDRAPCKVLRFNRDGQCIDNTSR